MAVKIGSARCDENGQLTGGQAGDQTGKEVCIQNWYNDSRGWRLLRAKDPVVAERIAWNMEAACANNNIGYDQSNNQSLFYEVSKYGWNCSKVTVPVETDCSQLIRVCVSFALGYAVPYFYTGDECEKLLATGAFIEITDKTKTSTSDYLRRGDILDTCVKGHTVAVLSDGALAHLAVAEDGIWGTGTTKATQRLLGTVEDGIISSQRYGNKKYLPAASTNSWQFKILGAKGSACIKALQDYVGADPDGIMGKQSVIALQKFLSGKGFMLSADGIMGKDTVKAWQRYLNEYFY